MTRYSAALLVGAAALALQSPVLARQETPAGTPAPPVAAAHPESVGSEKPAVVTLAQITEMYKSGTPTAALLNVVNTFEGEFDATIDDVIRMQRIGMPPELLRAIALKTSKSAGGSTSEEKLKALQEQMERETAEAEAQLAAMDEQLRKEGVEIPDAAEPLAEKKVVKMARQPEPGPSAVAAEVLQKGLKKLPEMNDLLQYRAEGVPATVIRAMGAAGLSGGKVPALAPAAAHAAAAAPGSVPPPSAAAAPPGIAAPIATAELVRLIQSGTDPETISMVVRQRGLAAPLGPTDVTTLRQAGATDQTILAINQAQAAHAQSARSATPPPASAAGGSAAPRQAPGHAPAPGASNAAPAAASAATAGAAAAAQEEPEAEEEVAQEPKSKSASAKRPRDVPSPQGDDRIWIASVPRGAQVYVAPVGIRRSEWSERDHKVGVTPMSLQLPPGDYIVVVQKPRDAFDAALLPAWRTKHDSPATRSVLDNADLMINARQCCLPESFTGELDIKPVSKDRPEILIGDMFDGLPPYMLDGEMYQILRVRKAAVESVMKAYAVRKSPGGSRTIVASFVPTLAEPLDPNTMAGLPEGTPYAEMLHAETLDYLSDAKQLPEIASTLRVEPAQLASAVTMLGRAGKAIIPQKIEGGLRTVTLALDDYGRLRVTDQPTKPVDPFAPVPETPKKKKKPAIPPPPPSLPAMTRTVVPGMGMPRLVLDNKSARGQALLFSDGQFYYVPAKTRREFVIEPGSFDVQLIAAQGAQAGPPPAGQLHFAYQARYTLTL